MRAARTSQGRARAARGRDRRRVGGLRRLRPGAGRRGRVARARAASGDRAVRQQRRHPCPRELPRRRPGAHRARAGRQLPRRHLVPARVRAGASRCSRRARREPRLRRGNRRVRSRRRVRGVEARAAGVLAIVGRAPPAAGDPGAHRAAGLRRDRGLSAALEAPQPAAASRRHRGRRRGEGRRGGDREEQERGNRAVVSRTASRASARRSCPGSSRGWWRAARASTATEARRPAYERRTSRSRPRAATQAQVRGCGFARPRRSRRAPGAARDRPFRA